MVKVGGGKTLHPFLFRYSGKRQALGTVGSYSFSKAMRQAKHAG